MTTLTVKIPSPSVPKIKEMVFNNNLDLDDTLERYMRIMNEYLMQASGEEITYEEEQFSDTAIEAVITLGTLPRYKDMKARYQHINFEEELMKRINQARSVYNDNCHEPDSLLLSQSIVTWHHRWVTAYIWVLMCCGEKAESDGAIEFFPVDKSVIELLFKRLEFSEIY